MSLFENIARLWSGRAIAAAVARQLAERLRALAPDLTWVLDNRDPSHSSLTLANRMIVTLDEGSDGVQARVLEPGQPGDDDPPLLLRAAYDVTNLAHALSWRARVPLG